MRNRFLTLAAALCGIALIALAGCDFGLGPQDAKPTALKGTVRVVLDNGQSAQDNSRTAVPAGTGFSYTLTFSAAGKPDVTASLYGNTTGEVSIDAGTWTLNVIGTYSGETVAESGAIAVTVPAEGEPITVSVTMRPVLNGAAGTFRYRISVSGALTDVSAVLIPLNVGDAEQGETDLYIASYERTASVAPGYYRLKVTARKGSQILIRREFVHIYSRTTTTKTYELGEEDFAPAVYLGGILTGGIEGYSPTEVIAYEDADGSVDIGQGAVSEDAWNMEVEGTPETVYFKVKLTKGSAGVYYSKQVIVSGVPALGKTGIVLSVEGYTITFDANGGLFEGGETTVVMTAPENETLTPPSAPQGSREFTGWYSGGKSFTAETRITDDTIVYAGWLLGLDDVASYLTNAQDGDTADNPVQLTLSADLANGGWEAILSAISAAGKYVVIDLAACVMTGTEFDPGIGNVGAGKVVALILPDAAKSIQMGNYYNPIFKDFTNLTFISGAGVETVGDYAFYNCTALESVSLPVAASIGSYAFYKCAALTSVSLPAATSIGWHAFVGCTALKAINLPAATDIGEAAFTSCTALTSVSLPVATSIGDFAFQGCTALESVSLPAMQTIPAAYVYSSDTYSGGMFSGCTALTMVSLPSATSIGERTFELCAALTSVSLPSATDIGYAAFYRCKALESVDLPAAISIGGSAFNNCTSLESVSLPLATSIGASAFYRCAALESVSLPASLAAVGSAAFAQCRNLSSITVDSANTVFSARDGMLLDKVGTALVAFPSANGDITLPTITSIGEVAFYECDALESVDLPAATDIGEAAFQGCTALESVSLPKATSIGDYAFAHYYYEVDSEVGSTYILSSIPLTSVDLPAATDIGEAAFQGCRILTSVSLPKATSIGDYAFYYCTALQDVSLPLATSIGIQAFELCEALWTVSLPAATSIGAAAFRGCKKLEYVDLPAATDIGGVAFWDCTALESVSLPATPPSIATGSDSGIFYYTGYPHGGTLLIAVPTGAVPAYTSAWGVSARTELRANPDVYGREHKGVLISDGDNW